MIYFFHSRLSVFLLERVMVSPSRANVHGDLACPLARGRANGNFYILTQNSEKFHQATNGYRHGFQSHEG